MTLMTLTPLDVRMVLRVTPGTCTTNLHFLRPSVPSYKSEQDKRTNGMQCLIRLPIAVGPHIYRIHAVHRIRVVDGATLRRKFDHSLCLTHSWTVLKRFKRSIVNACTYVIVPNLNFLYVYYPSVKPSLSPSIKSATR